MNAATFLAFFQEFRDTDPTIVTSKLVQASVRMGGPDTTIWGSYAAPGQTPTQADIAQGNLAAHYLYMSPFGTSLRLADPDNDKTPYWDVFIELARALSVGPIVAGGLYGAATQTTTATLQPGSGTVSLVNGSPNVTFSFPQTLAAGTLMVFIGAQQGAYYALASNVSGTTGVLTAVYTGPTATASSWNHA